MHSIEPVQGNGRQQKVCLECHREFTGMVAACPHDNSILVPIAQDPLIGTKLAGKYEILSLLGTGGMGVVYKGRQEVMDRFVAIKMLQAHHVADSISVKRFQQEGKNTCRLNHPHIITVYDFGISPHSAQPFIVMDYLQGVPLSDVIKQEGQVSVDRSIKIFTQSAEALAHAHKQGVVHRDLKPSNIVLINYDGDKDFVKVVDFGVAHLMEEVAPDSQRLTQAGDVCGSPVYMSPEQCQGFKIDARSDIYSMGVVMYETLTNRLPLLGRTMVETMRKHIEDPPPPFSQVRPDLYIPERVEAVILKALAKDPADRHQSMDQLITELELAIPRPGRSQVLRSSPAEDEGVEQQISPAVAVSAIMDRMSWMHWAGILAATIVIGTLVIVALIMLSTKSKTATVQPQTVQVKLVEPSAHPGETETRLDPLPTSKVTTSSTTVESGDTTPSNRDPAVEPDVSTPKTVVSETPPTKTVVTTSSTTVAKTPPQVTSKPVVKKPKKAAQKTAKANQSKPQPLWRSLARERSYDTHYGEQ